MAPPAAEVISLPVLEKAMSSVTPSATLVVDTVTRKGLGDSGEVVAEDVDEVVGVDVIVCDAVAEELGVLEGEGV